MNFKYVAHIIYCLNYQSFGFILYENFPGYLLSLFCWNHPVFLGDVEVPTCLHVYCAVPNKGRSHLHIFDLYWAHPRMFIFTKFQNIVKKDKIQEISLKNIINIRVALHCFAENDCFS